MGTPQGWQGAAMTTIPVTWIQLAPGLAPQNTCVSAHCSTDLTMTEVRPPKFLDGNEPTETMSRATVNAGTVAGGALFQPFPHATPRNPSRPSRPQDTLESYYVISAGSSKMPLQGRSDFVGPGKSD